MRVSGILFLLFGGGSKECMGDKASNCVKDTREEEMDPFLLCFPSTRSIEDVIPLLFDPANLFILRDSSLIASG